MSSAADGLKLKNFLESEKVFEFLDGLNLKLDQVRGQVLSRQPHPSQEKFMPIRKGKKVEGL